MRTRMEELKPAWNSLKTPLLTEKKDHMLRCGSEDSSHFGMTTFISLSRYNCWQQTHKNRKNLKFHNRLQSPVVFYLLLKQIHSLLCLFNLIWVAWKASCFSLRCRPPSSIQVACTHFLPSVIMIQHPQFWHCTDWSQDWVLGQTMQ